MYAPQQMFARWRYQPFYEEPGEPGGGGGGGADEAIKRAAFERDNAKAEAAKIKRELEELRKALPTDEQKARWAELEKDHETAEEERKRKAGEFDGWRKQISDKHAAELEATRKQIEEEQKRTAQSQSELNNTLIGLAFAGATDLFSPTGQTVLLPEVAQSYFGKQVEVQTDEATGRRSVVVKDATGTVLMDPKTGTPLDFGRAMKEVIDAHPSKDQLLRGSGKVGSGSPGGGHGGSGNQIDLNRLKPEDFHKPEVQQALRRQSENAGGLVVAPALRRLQQK